MTPLLAASGLSFSYGPTPVLDDISLTLAPAKVVALIGPNGSGKSTLIKLLSAHLRPAAGEISLQGQALHSWRRRLLARTVSYLPQTPTFEPGDLVSDVLRLGRACYWTAFGVETDRDLKVVAETARRLELTDLMHRRMDALSGGQRQRVFVGRCLVQEPSILFLDEPNTYLDLKHQVELLKLLRGLSHEHGLSVLMASHDLNLAGAFADELLLLAEGRLIAQGPATDVLKPELIARAYGLEMTAISMQGLPILFPKL